MSSFVWFPSSRSALRSGASFEFRASIRPLEACCLLRSQSQRGHLVREHQSRRRRRAKARTRRRISASTISLPSSRRSLSSRRSCWDSSYRDARAISSRDRISFLPDQDFPLGSRPAAVNCASRRLRLASNQLRYGDCHKYRTRTTSASHGLRRSPQFCLRDFPQQ